MKFILTCLSAILLSISTVGHSQWVFPNTIFVFKSTIDFNDITDDYVVVREISQNSSVNLDVDLQLLFESEANTTKKMLIDTSAITGLKPTCEELVRKLGLDQKTNCYAYINNSPYSLGTSGTSGSSCTNRQRAVYKNKQICETICHGKKVRGVCAEPDQICTNKKVVDHWETDQSCASSELSVYFDTTGAEAVDGTRINTFVSVNKVMKNTTTTLNGVQVGDVVKEEVTKFRSKLVKVQSASYLQLLCADGSAISSPFNVFQHTESISYSSIYQSCPNQSIKLVSNRSFVFDGGTLVFTFDPASN